MTLRISLYDSRGATFDSSLKVMSTFSIKFINLETMGAADIEVAFTETTGGLQLSYNIPFFDHQISVKHQNREIQGSPMRISLTSVDSNVRCVYCRKPAIQAYLLEKNGSGQEARYVGFCSSHINNVSQHQCDKTPQKCNLR